VKEARGTHFDPDVVDAFFAIQDEILDIKKQYDEENQNIIDFPDIKALLTQYNLSDTNKAVTTNHTKKEGT
jgi:putative two-component system response regulator